MLVSHEEASQAVYDAIILKDYDNIDSIIDARVGTLISVKHSKTPIFIAIERILSENKSIDDANVTAVTGLIVEGLNHIFEKVEQKLASADKSDNEVLLTFTDRACNHISHTWLLPSGATVRDMLEQFCRLDFSKRPHDNGFIDVYKLVNRYELKNKTEVVEEKLTAKASRNKGRDL